MSRGFKVEMDGKKQSIVVPYACLFNFYAEY